MRFRSIEGWGIRPGLFFFFLDFHGFDVLGFEDLPAIQTFDVVHAVSSRDDLGAGMLAGLHMQQFNEIYSNCPLRHVKPPFRQPMPARREIGSIAPAA